MYVVSAIALLTLLGGVQPFLLKTQPDGIQTPPPLTAQQAGSYYPTDQQIVDSDSGLKGLKPERQYPELQGLQEQQQQQLPYLPQNTINPTLAYVIIKPIPQQWFPQNYGYERQPIYQQPYLPAPYRETIDDSGIKAPAKGHPAPPPPPPPYQPQPDDFPVQEPHDYYQEVHAKKQSKLSKLKQHIDRVFQKFASHSSYEIDENHHLRPTSAPDTQQTVQTFEEPEAQVQVQHAPVKEERGQLKQQVIEEPKEIKEIKEIKEHREELPKKEAVRAQQVITASHADDGFSKRHIN